MIASHILSLLAVMVLVAGCSSGGTPPVSDRSRVDNSTERQAARAVARQKVARGSYRVVAGDTLYSIAWRYQRDFRDLAALNRIPAPFEIYPGQVLKVQGAVPKGSRLQAQAGQRIARPTKPAAATADKPHPLASTSTKPQTGAPVRARQSSNAKRPAVAKPAPARTATSSKSPAVPRTGPVALSWPSNGKRVRAFGSQATDSGQPSKNVDFVLPAGGAIRAAGAGEVVFARARLAGFRQFVILKHNDTWLSSYGFNAPLRVREGQQVAAGATLATLDRRGSGLPNERVLRFEVRKDGTPVNPTSVIKRAN